MNEEIKKKQNPMIEEAETLQEKCAVIRCSRKKIKGCDGFCREHYLKTREKLQ